MTQIRYTLAVVTFFIFAASINAAAQEPRVVVLSAPETDPKASEVIFVLEEHLLEVEIAVSSWEAEAVPSEEEVWLKEASAAAKKTPGTVALIGYECNEKECSLVLVEPRLRTLLEVPVKIPKHKDFSVAFAIAATAREAILGPLLPELARLARHGESPSPPPPSPDSIWLQPHSEKKKHVSDEPARPWLWLEG